MALELSPDDFISCIHYAQKICKRCVDAPAEFRAVGTAVASLQSVLGEVQESVSGIELSERKTDDLGQLISGCNLVLREVQSLLYKHKDLGNQSRRSWNRLSWSRDPTESTRQRAIAKIGLLTAFNLSIASASQARVQKLLQQLLFEHQAGLHEHSVISSANLELVEEGNERAWFLIGRELEHVGITSVMSRDHREYIIRWIRHALKLGKLAEGAELPSVDSQPSSVLMHEHEKFITIIEESVSVRTTSSQARNSLYELRNREESTITMSDLTPDPPDPPRPGDVTLSEKQSPQYTCAHVYCKEHSHKRYTTWFEILLHARTNHATGSTPWSKYHWADFQEGTSNHRNLLCVNDSGKYLASSTPYSNIPMGQDRDEVAYVLAQLYQAVQNSSISVEIPQLIYDLYYSTRCAFSDCRVTSRNDSEHREHFIGHFQTCEAPLGHMSSSARFGNSRSEEPTHNMEALARVQRRYVYPTDDSTTKKRGFRGLGLFKRAKHDSPPRSTNLPPSDTLPYRTMYSGQTIEDIVGASAADTRKVSIALSAHMAPSPRPQLQPQQFAKNKINRLSKPTAFALIPEFRISQDNQKRSSSDYMLGATGFSDDYQVDSHALSEKLAASQEEREGVLFIMASLRQTLGVSK